MRTKIDESKSAHKYYLILLGLIIGALWSFVWICSDLGFVVPELKRPFICNQHNYTHERYCPRPCQLPVGQECGCDTVKGCPQTIIVPRLVHYAVWNGCILTFWHAISMRSVFRNIKPESIYIWGFCSKLRGHLWDKYLTKEEQSRIHVTPLNRPMKGAQVNKLQQ